MTILAKPLAAAAGLLLLTTLTACSSNGSGDDRTGGDRAGGDSSSLTAQRAAVAKCLRDKGYDEPDPDGNASSINVTVPEGADPDKYVQDNLDCAKKVGIKQGEAKELPGGDELTRKVASCVREHGFSDYPDDEEAASRYHPSDQAQFDRVQDDCVTTASGATSSTGAH